MPNKSDAASANITDKESEAEQLAITDICIAVRSFFIQSSKWSNSLSPQQILVRLRENLEYDEEFHEDGMEKDWRSICWWPHKVTAIKARDSQP